MIGESFIQTDLGVNFFRPLIITLSFEKVIRWRVISIFVLLILIKHLIVFFGWLGSLEITFNNHMVVEKPVKKIALNGGRQLLDTIIEDIDKIERASLPSRWAWIIEN